MVGVSCAVALWSAPAQAQPLGCGAVVTQDITLDADITGCTGAGLIVGAAGVTIDLGGHTISGTSISGGDPAQIGIDDGAGHDAVVIRNGVVRDFGGAAVRLTAVDGATVSGLDVSFGQFGIHLDGGSGNRLIGNTVANAPVGIAVFGTAGRGRNNVVSGNTVSAANTAGVALRYGEITGTRIENNDVSVTFGVDRWGAAIAVGARYTTDEGTISGTLVRRNVMHELYANGGVFVSDAAADTRVEFNRVDNALGLPPYEIDGDRTLVRNNSVSNTEFPGFGSYGIQVDQNADRTVVEANSISRAASISIDDSGQHTVVRGNRIEGLPLSSGTGTGFNNGIIVREAARDGRIESNIVSRLAAIGGLAPGAGIEILGDHISVTANAVSEIDTSDGIRVDPAADNATVTGNIVRAAGDDGIDLQSPATTVTANLAVNNTDHGIEAVAGVRDGGANYAFGNGADAQCVGVRCRP
jgi:large repetitive protein